MRFVAKASTTVLQHVPQRCPGKLPVAPSDIRPMRSVHGPGMLAIFVRIRGQSDALKLLSSHSCALIGRGTNGAINWSVAAPGALLVHPSWAAPQPGGDLPWPHGCTRSAASQRRQRVDDAQCGRAGKSCDRQAKITNYGWCGMLVSMSKHQRNARVDRGRSAPAINHALTLCLLQDERRA